MLNSIFTVGNGAVNAERNLPNPILQALAEMERRQREADTLRMPQPMPQARNLTLLESLLGIAGSAIDPRGQAGQQFLGGVQQGIQRQHQGQLQDYAMNQQANEVRARGLERQGESGLRQAEFNYQDTMRRKKEALDAQRYQEQTAYERQRDQVGDEFRQKTLDAGKEKVTTAAKEKEKNTLIGQLNNPGTDAKSIPAILEKLALDHNWRLSPESEMLLLQKSYRQENVEAGTENTKARTETENATRDAKVQNLLARNDLLGVQKEVQLAQRDYRKLVNEWYPKEMASKINDRHVRTNIALKRLDIAMDAPSLTPKQVMEMERDVDHLEAELQGLNTEQQLLLQQLNQAGDDKRRYKVSDAIDANLAQQRVIKSKLGAAKERVSQVAVPRSAVESSGAIGPVRLSGPIGNAGTGTKKTTTKKPALPPGWKMEGF